MKQTHKKIVILGGGLSGLTIAYKISKKITNIILLEKEIHVGGTARTFQKEGYEYDLTGHALHLSDESVKKMIFWELKLNDSFTMVERKSGIYIDGNILPYPFQYNLSYLPTKIRNKCLIDYLEVYYKFKLQDKVSTFEDYCNNFLGNGISKIFMKPYNEKLWATQSKNMTTDWMGKFVPKSEYEKIVEGAIIKKNIDNSGYNAFFYYPKNGGIQIISDRLFEKISTCVKTNINIERIDLNEKKIYYPGNIISYDYLISTIPLPELLKLINIKIKEKINLEWTIVRAFFISVSTNQSIPYSWIYVPEKFYKIYRIGNFSKFSKDLSRNGRDLLYVETSVNNKHITELPDYLSILPELEKILKIDKELIQLIDVVDINPAYSIYNKYHKNDTQYLRDLLKSYNVFLSGRYGNWQFYSMEDSIKDGLTLTKNIIEKYHKEFNDETN